MTYANGGGARIHFEVEGEGEPVVLLPGLGQPAASWQPVGERLAPSHRVVLIDPRGAGQSDRPDVPYTGEVMAADVVAVLDAAGIERAHLVGHAFGALIAQETALRHGERVKSVVLAGTYASTDAWTRRIFEVRKALIEHAGFGEQMRMATLFLNSPHEFRTELDRIEALERRVAESPPELPPYLRQIDFILQHDARDRLPGLGIPALVVSGAEDLLATAARGRELAELIPGAEYHEYPDAAHDLVRQKAPHLAGLIGDFVTRHSAG